VAGWPYHKFNAVTRAHRLNAEREARLMRRLREGDDDVLEWNSDRFTRPRD